MRIEVATLAEVDAIASLFDAYRVFYRRPSDPDAARQFIHDRLSAGESHILCAVDDDGRLVGFTQLYPTFSSVSLGTIWILNDLFVDPAARRRGVGRMLLAAARDHAAEGGAVQLKLSTQKTNTAAQALYESTGWVRDEEFYQYQLAVAG